MWKVIGSVAATLTMFSFVPQILKISRSKSVNDLSVVTLVQFTAGVSLWLIYGLHLRNYIIIVANSVTLLSLLILLALFIFFRGKNK